VRAAHRNGLDYVELDQNDSSGQTLEVYFLGHLPGGLRPQHLRIEGGRRVREIRVTRLNPEPGKGRDRDDVLRIFVDRTGDFSTYTLRIVATDEEGREAGPYPGLDVRYSSAEFSFKPGCPADLDCGAATPCPEERPAAPEINYLAKDYGSFRQLLLDRLAVLLPQWRESHVPDLGIALVEFLAYTGDYLSLFQDAVATEAYLETARQRISLRRHARLVDYRVHEGCNARTWVTVESDTDFDVEAADLVFLTSPDPLVDPSRPHAWDEFEGIDPRGYEVFEPLRPSPSKTVRIRAGLSRIRIYTWANAECCLPKGATSATLLDEWDPAQIADPGVVVERNGGPGDPTHVGAEVPPPARDRGRPLADLRAGDILIFEEVLGPTTGNPADADRSHRWAVRLTEVTRDQVDELVKTGECSPDGCHLVHVSWRREDALPFPLCISSRLPIPPCSDLSDVSVAWGNVILVDHGRTTERPIEPPVPPVDPIPTCDPCEDAGTDPSPEPYRPALMEGPLAWSARIDPAAPATRMLDQDARAALPSLSLDAGDGTSWHPVPDLLASGPGDRDFVAEIDNDGSTHLRFGDGELGARPVPGTRFGATLRIGNGPRGNVGAESIRLLVLRRTTLSGVVLTVRNPLPAVGGLAAETLAHIRRMTPGAFRRDRQRAVIAADYAELVERDFGREVQGAAAALRWNGSWYEVNVGVDQVGRVDATGELLDRVRRRLHNYRRIGHDVRVGSARSVPLAVALHACAAPHVLRADVRAALLELFSSRMAADGRLGFFHPDRLEYGQDVYLSALVAQAGRAPGVADVVVTKLERLGEPSTEALETGVLSLGSLEIARLDNDPTFPEFGQLTVTVGGGR